ncbi:MAG: hypothetical protein CMH50_11045 [Myxococcales bacterium]|nr:hypothetical protein [Myxococcales bacterium]
MPYKTSSRLAFAPSHEDLGNPSMTVGRPLAVPVWSGPFYLPFYRFMLMAIVSTLVTVAVIFVVLASLMTFMGMPATLSWVIMPMVLAVYIPFLPNLYRSTVGRLRPQVRRSDRFGIRCFGGHFAV